MQGEPTAGSDDGVRGDLRFGTIGRLVRSAAAEHGDREALVDLSAEPALRLGFTELAERSRELGAALVAAGIEPGDRVAVWEPNCWEWVVTLLGMESAGAVLVPLNTRYKGLEAAEILRRSRARMLFTVEGFLGNDYVSMLREATPDGIDSLDLGVVLLRDTGSRPPGVGTRDELLAAVDDDARAGLDLLDNRARAFEIGRRDPEVGVGLDRFLDERIELGNSVEAPPALGQGFSRIGGRFSFGKACGPIRDACG